MSQINDLDQMEDNIVNRIAPSGLGKVTRASSSGGSRGGSVTQTSTIVQGGKPKDEFLIGDPFTNNFYFKDAPTYD